MFVTPASSVERVTTTMARLRKSEELAMAMSLTYRGEDNEKTR